MSEISEDFLFKQTEQTLMKFQLMWHFIWVFTVCTLDDYLFIED